MDLRDQASSSRARWEAELAPPQSKLLSENKLFNAVEAFKDKEELGKLDLKQSSFFNEGCEAPSGASFALKDKLTILSAMIQAYRLPKLQFCQLPAQKAGDVKLEAHEVSSLPTKLGMAVGAPSPEADLLGR